MFRFATVGALLFSCTSLLFASDPAAAVGAARQAIEAREYDRAIALLQSAIPEAAAIIDQEQRDDALAAIHFYAALAWSNQGNHEKARAELKQFAAIRRGSNALDPNKYPAAFVALFKEVAARLNDAPQGFDRYYPGFGAIASATSRPPALPLWGTSAEMQILASSAERQDWERLRDDDARREFVAKFWVSRDPDASTPHNEWREEFNRRVLFADETFGSGSDAIRGSVTDRGRVFVLLGPPARVYLRNISRRQGGFLQVNGTEEKWVYFKGQLPATIPQNQIDFVFLDQPAYGDHVMTRDFLPLRALAEAQKTLSGTR